MQYVAAVIKSFAAIAISVIIIWILNNQVIKMPDVNTDNVWRSVLVCLWVFIENAVILIPATLFLAFNNEDRQVIVNKIKSKIRVLICFNG